MVTAGVFVAPLVAVNYPVSTAAATVVACLAFWGARRLGPRFGWRVERPSLREGEP